VEATLEVGDVLAAETGVEVEVTLEAEVVASGLQELKTTQDEAIKETATRRFLLCIFDASFFALLISINFIIGPFLETQNS
jgi:hypothetical protein